MLPEIPVTADPDSAVTPPTDCPFLTGPCGPLPLTNGSDMVLTLRTLAFLQPPTGGVCLQPLVSQLGPLQGFGEVEEPWCWVSGEGNPKERWEHLTSGLRPTCHRGWRPGGVGVAHTEKASLPGWDTR